MGAVHFRHLIKSNYLFDVPTSMGIDLKNDQPIDNPLVSDQGKIKIRLTNHKQHRMKLFLHYLNFNLNVKIKIGTNKIYRYIL